MVRSFVVSLLALASAVSAVAVPEARDSVNCTGVAAVSPRCRSNEVKYTRDVFYVGGRLINTGTANITADQ